jgi:peptide/nickel transport system permease protein
MSMDGQLGTLARAYTQFRSHYVVDLTVTTFLKLWKDRPARFAIVFLSSITLVGILGPSFTTYEYNEVIYVGGELQRNNPPSLIHPFGTDVAGRDLFSRVITGTRPTLITGFVGGSVLITIGTGIGLTAGYVGGWVENVLMRITDFAFAVPLLPFGIVIIGLVDFGYFTSIVVIGLLLWRSSARVIRSQVLQVKEQEYITAIEAEGASTPYIIFRHILPNVAPLAVLYFALGVGYAILLQAGLTFIGVLEPFVPSWGVMIRNAFESGYVTSWWWTLPPGILLSLTVLSSFLIGRRYEDLAGSGWNTAEMEMEIE